MKRERGRREINGIHGKDSCLPRFSFIPRLPRSLFLLLLPGLFFWRETLGQRVLGDQDAVFWFLPVYRLVAAQLMAGELPLWNPDIYSGMPLFGGWQAGVLDPLNWAYTLFGATTRTLTAVQEMSFALALLAAYAYARSIDLGRRASTLAAVVYAFSGFAVARTLYPGLLHIAALTPLVLWSIERMRRQADGAGIWRSAAVGAFVLAWQLFAAHPQPFLYSSLLAVAYAGFLAFASELAPRARRRFAIGCAVLFIGGGGLACVQLLPAWEVARASVRGAWSYELFTLNSLHPISLLVALFPFLHGGGGGIYRLPFWGSYWHHHEAQIYLGLSTLVLALGGVWAAWRGRERRMIFWCAAGGAGGVLALGKYAGPAAWALYRVPVLNNFRSPNRYWMIVALAAAMLSGYAVDRLLRSEDRSLARLCGNLSAGLSVLIAGLGGLALWRRGAVERAIRALPDYENLPAGFLEQANAEFWMPMLAAAGSTLAVLVFLKWRLRSRWATAVLLGALLADLNLYATFAPIHADPRRWSQMGEALPPELKTSDEPYRAHLLLHRAAGQFEPFRFAGREMATGYDPLLDARYKGFSGIEEAGRSYLKSIVDDRDRTLDLLNVRYLMVAPEVFDDPALASLSDEERATVRRWRAGLENEARWRLLDRLGRDRPYPYHRIYENLRVLPRAWLTSRVEAMDGNRRIEAIRGETGEKFDVRHAAIVGYEDIGRLDPALLGNVNTVVGAVRIVERRAGRQVFEVDADRVSMLVMSEMYAPGWRARVDGEEQEIFRVDEVLRGVTTTAGKHRVEVYYRPWTVMVGAMVSSVTAVALLLLGVASGHRSYSRSRNRKRPGSYFSASNSSSKR